MPNSIIEQLQRDAKKEGAFQAKIAYAKYLLETQQIDAAKTVLLSDLPSDNLPIKYQAEAKLVFARCLEREAASSPSSNRELIKHSAMMAYEEVIGLLSGEVEESVTHLLYPALTALAALYQNINVIKSVSFQDRADRLEKPLPSVQVTAKATPEFSYKILRHRFQTKDPSLSLLKYQEALLSLLEEPELTDTLKAKIIIQNIVVSLMSAQETGSVNPLRAAQNYILQLENSPELNKMLKAERLKYESITATLREELRVIDVMMTTLPSRSPHEISARVKGAADMLLKKDLFRKKEQDYGSMTDLDSRRPIGISFFGHAEQSKLPGAQAYLRAISSPSNIKVTAKTLVEGRDHCVELPSWAKVSDFRHVFNSVADVTTEAAEDAKQFVCGIRILDEETDQRLSVYGITKGSILEEKPRLTPKC